MSLDQIVLLNQKASFIKVFSLTALCAASFLPFSLVSNTYATSYSASITTSGAQSINVAPSGSGGTGTSISADDITITTTCRAGYNLSLSTSVNDNNLYLGGDSSNNTTDTYFSPASGSTALSESPNTWGYFMPSDNNAPTSSSTFLTVPTMNNPVTIKTPLATPSETDINDTFNVYYGVAVSSSVSPGTYKMIPDTNNSNNDFLDSVINKFSNLTSNTKLKIIFIVIIFYIVFVIINIFQLSSLLNNNQSKSNLNSSSKIEHSTDNQHTPSQKNSNEKTNTSSDSSQYNNSFNINDYFSDSQLKDVYEKHYKEQYSSFYEFKKAVSQAYQEYYF